MGYTHYWHRKADLSVGWDDFLSDFKKVFKNLPKDLKIAGEFGEGEPVFNNNRVSFNGEGELSHESFSLPRIYTIDEKRYSNPDPDGFHFSFCKTAMMPYDLLVMATLILAKIHFCENIKVSSDGTWRDWRDARTLIANTLGYKDIKNFLKR